MSFEPPQEQAKPQAKPQAAHSIGASVGAHVIKGLGSLGWLDDLYDGAVNGLGGWGPHAQPDGQSQAAAPGAAQAKALAQTTEKATGETANLAPALHSAAAGATVAEQAQQLTGPVKLNAASALNIAAQMAPDSPGTARTAIQQANQGAGGYQSPFVGVALSGIRNDQQQAEAISRNITGDQTPHGYAAYGSNSNSYGNQTGDAGIVSPGSKSPSGYPGAENVDAANDVAAVTQYAAAAELGIKLTPNTNGNGQTVAIDWAALSKMDVSADLGVLGGKINYDNPAQVANNGYEAVMAEIAERKGDPKDKGQFISLTGHSGGGQSSFYTALKLASQGYSNISLAGVDMAMTPHEREVLETMGVKVTNITSHNNDPNTGAPQTSEIGEVIRTGMGGGQNFYDLNVERQQQTDALGRHDIGNDANVETTVRYAQYLDSIGQHGAYGDQKLYQQFLADTHGKGDQTNAGTADPNLVQKITDQRALPGPEANSPDPAKAGSVIESAVKWLGGNRIESAIAGAGTQVDHAIDKAGDSAGSWVGGMFGKAGSFLGGLAHQGMDALGSGVNAVGGMVSNGLDGAGHLMQGAMNLGGDAVNFAGGVVNQGLGLLGSGVNTAGSAIDNGLHGAGDTAKSWLGNIPLIGGALGTAADKGLGWLGDGVGAVSNLTSSGLNVAGNAAQSAGGMFSGAMNWLGGAAHSGLDMLGSGVQSLSGAVGSGLDKVGAVAQSGISSAVSTVGGWAGGAVNGAIDTVGHVVGNEINQIGGMVAPAAGWAVDGLVHMLQGVGFDTGQISGLGNYDSSNPSVQRNWKSLLSDPNDPSKVQQINVPGPASAPSTGPTMLAQAPDPYAQHAMYAD